MSSNLTYKLLTKKPQGNQQVITILVEMKNNIMIEFIRENDTLKNELGNYFLFIRHVFI